jgi:hypothetical protein
MKICWDNIENLHITRNGNFRDTKKNKTYLEEICEVCGNEYLKRRDAKSNVCSKECLLQSEKYKENLRNCRLGEKNPFYGKTHSEKTKKILSESRKGKKFPKLSEAMIGRKMPRGEDSPCWKGFKSKNLPQYDILAKQLEPIEECRRNEENPLLLEVRCTYCNHWFVPSLTRTNSRVQYIKGNPNFRETRLYCSRECKSACPIFNQKKYPKGFKIDSSREVQPELRKLCFERDNYTCIKCGLNKEELKEPLHCHHVEGIKQNPIESADLDMVITLCKSCHKSVHLEIGCKYNELKCENLKMGRYYLPIFKNILSY